MIRSWIPFCFLAGLSLTAYNVFMKLAGGKINGFLFTGLFNLVSAASLIGLYYFLKATGKTENVTIEPSAWGYIIALGLLVASFDVLVFHALLRGGDISTAFPIIYITIFACTVIAGFFLFHEAQTLTKIFGLILGAASIYLLMK